MSVVAFLAELSRLGVRVWADGNQLRCRAPKGVMTVSLRSKLTEHKTELLTWLSQHQEHGSTELVSAAQLPRLIPTERTQNLPLSFAQSRLWFLDRLAPESNVAYMYPLILHLLGELFTQALEQSLQELVCRHESLRTTFTESMGQPVQVIHPAGGPVLPVIDLQGLSPERREEEVSRLAEQEVQSPCDLINGPLMRANLLQLDGQEHALLFILHHIISDAWSASIFKREMAALYHARINGEPSPLAPLPIQYADYAIFQREWLQGEVLDVQMAYWRKQLADVPPLSLPTDRPRPAMQTYRGAKEERLLPEETSARLKALSRAEHVTLFMTLLSAFQVLLARYTSQEDIAVGTPIANRSHVELEGMLGFFANTLVMRTDLSGHPTFVEVLRRVREVCLGAYAHQDIPFEKIVKVLAQGKVPVSGTEPTLERDLSRTPLFQVMLVVQQNERVPEEMGGVRIKPLVPKSTSAKFDLTLLIEEREQGLHMAVEYNTDLFEAETATRWLRNFQTLLEGIVQNPYLSVSELPLLTDAERKQLLAEWNATQASSSLDMCVHQLFEQQVERTPEAIAVVFEESSLTYAKLNSQANRLAHCLRECVVGPDVLVGVCMERSLDMLIALLAVLKAGGAFVPLDPAYPQERLAYLIQDTRVAVLLAQSHLHERLRAESIMIIHVDAEIEGQENHPVNVTQPDHLAYVIYTSGSTGQPKGVMNTHRGLSNRLLWMQHAYQLTSEDRILQKTPFSFDVSVWEFFWPLLTGASLVIARPGGHQDLTYLRALIARQQVTTLHFVPSMLQVFLSSEPTAYQPYQESGTSLRLVICSGEALSVELQARFFARFTEGVQLQNLYGPTEASIDVTSWPCQREGGDHRVPIGRPIANTQIYLLDKNLSPVPIGVPAEVYIGGVGLARGYWQRPELTAEKFIVDPFAGTGPAQGTAPAASPQEPTAPVQLGARIYRTGDLARYRADGVIEYLGRTDHQVKIRGFRVELGEIEATLMRHPAIHEAVVLSREPILDEKRLAPVATQLVAYVVGEGSTVLSVSELRNYLQEKLPDYMVPAFFVLLPALPLSTNGKVDRKALPGPLPPSRHERSFAAPSSPIEQCLCAIWQQVLSTQVGIHDNFFALGGDSILSMQVVARAQQEGFFITPKHLFQHPTIAQLALVVRPLAEAQGTGDESAEVIGPVPLTPIQHWFFEQEQPTPQHYNQSVLLQVPANWQVRHLQHVADVWLLQHDALRLRYERTETGWQQRLVSRAEVGTVAVEHVDLRDVEAEEQTSAVADVANRVQASLDLQHGPLLRMVLLEMGHGQASRLLIVIHHLCVDGVSWRVLLSDLQAAMTRAGQDEPLALPTRMVSFQRWAQHLQQIARERLDEDRAYWLAAAQVPTVPLPRDTSAEGGNTQASARLAHVVLTSEETRLLLQDAQRPYRSQIQELLLVALLQTLGHWMGTRQIRLDLEGHGREELFGATLDVSRTVGWFTGLYPVLFTLPEDRATSTWIKTIKEQLRRVPHKGISYGLLRYPGHRSGASPDHKVPGGDEDLREQLASAFPSEVSFNYLGQFDHPLIRSSETLFGESSGAVSGPENTRSYILDVLAQVVAGRLHLQWIYHEQLYKKSTIERLANEMVQALRDLLAHCLDPSVGGWTPADFPLVGSLDQATLDRLLAGREGLTEDLYPLTPLQQGILFHTLSAPRSGVYIEQMSCTLRGEFEVGAFERAWQQVVRQHAILRTAFVWQELGEPLQIVFKQATLPIKILDWRSHEPSVQEAELEGFLQADRAEAFDLELAPLMRLTLVWLSETRTQMIWTHHHLLLDGWSMSLLLQEVLACYEADIQGRRDRIGARHDPYGPCPVQEERRPYRDYISWLAEQESEEAETYWRQLLSGIVAPTPLGVDLSGGTRTEVSLREEQSGWMYAEETLQVDAVTTARWQEYAKRVHVTLHTLVQAAWALVLACYSGESDVVFGTVVAGRPSELMGVERMIGLFINTVPVRIQVKAEEEVESWLRRLQEQQVEQRPYEYSSLVQIQRWSDIPREHLMGLAPGHNHLFESLLVFENYPMLAVGARTGASPVPTAPALEVEALQMREQTNYPLTIIVVPGAEMRLHVSYDRQRFAQATAEQMLGHLQNGIEQLVTDRSRQLARISLLTEAECEQLVVQWNATATDTMPNLCVHQLFEQQVERTPDAIAVIFEENSLTYAKLNSQANQLAHRLRECEVGPDVLVGVCMEPSRELVVALLAVLKAGGAYVPLDPFSPADRLQFMLADAHITLVVTELSHLSTISQLSEGITVLCLDQDAYLRALQNTQDPHVPVCSEHLAYVIYTSGSTGEPKGVMIPHANLLRLFAMTQAWFGFQAEDVWTLFHSSAFDFSVWEIWGALLHGGSLVVVPYWVSRSPDQFARLLLDQQVTVLNQTPSAFRLLMQQEESHQTLHGLALRLIIFGGEALDVGSLQPWMSRHGDEQPQLINMYGITETTVHVTSRPLSLGDVTAERGSVIGRAIPDLQLFILDKRQQLVPIGVLGELYVGGMGLARGYLRRPELTAERFLPHPWSQEPGARLYRTGDLVRYRSDGDLEYLGRTDHQVKIRGFRVELGEIEAILMRHPLIREAVVLSREDIEDEQRLARESAQLVAYVVGEGSKVLSVSALRSYLQEKLPDYMVPAFFVPMSAFPLSTNGKVDRKALPPPSHERSKEDEAFLAPRTATEKMLATIWEEVLHTKEVGVRDNFFERGGDSIQCLQVVARARQKGRLLTIKQIFQYPTIEQLAAIVGMGTPQHNGKASQGLVEGLLPLTPIQRWFFELDLAHSHHWNQALFVETKERLQSSILQEVVRAWLIHHDALRLRFTPSRDGWQQSYSEREDSTPFFMVDLQQLPQDEQETVTAKLTGQTQASLDLVVGPLVRVVLFDRGKMQAQGLLMVIHHLAVDGVSWHILLEDLQTAYQQRWLRQAIQLPAKTSSFKEWAEHLQHYARQQYSPAMQQEQSYWLSRNVARVQPLPLDFPETGQVNTVASSAQVEASLSAEETSALLSLVPSVLHTQINDVLLTALVQTLTQWIGSSTVLVDLEGHGREDLFTDVDVSRTVGWFTTLFPVSLSLEETSTVSEALHAVQEQLRAIPHHGIGYGILRYLSGDPAVKEQMQRHQKADVLFNYQGQLNQGYAATFLSTPSFLFAQPARSLQGRRTHLLEINSHVSGNQLRVAWSYSQRMHERSTIEHLVNVFLDTLRLIIRHSQFLGQGQATAPTRSYAYMDSQMPTAGFPRVEFHQEPIEQLLMAEVPPLVRMARPELIPLSFAQQRLWFLDQLEQGNTAYLICNVLRVAGRLDVHCWERSLQELICRHESLRTIFVVGMGRGHDPQPAQVILPIGGGQGQAAVPTRLPVIDLQGLLPERQEQEARKQTRQEAQHPMSLSRGPLLRTHMLRLGQQVSVLLLTLHHIIVDGWSNELLLRELMLLYRAFLAGQPSPLKPLPLQCADYALWQRQWLRGKVLDALRDYWTKHLAGAKALELPTDRPRTSLRVGQERGPESLQGKVPVSGMIPTDLAYNSGAVYHFTLPARLWPDLMTLSREVGATIFMTLLAAFQIVLSRSTGKLDIVVGTDVANRASPEMEEIVGFFLNLLVLRVQLISQDTFRETLRKVATTVLEAYAHQDLPFEQLVDALRLERKLDQTPLVNVLFVFQNMPRQLPNFPGLTVISAELEIPNAKFDLALVLEERGQEIRGYVDYRSDLFDPHTIATLVQQFTVLLQSIVTSPDIPIERLEMWSREDKEQHSKKEGMRQEAERRKLKVTKRRLIALTENDFESIGG